MILGGLSLGTVASFLQLSRTFSQPLGRLSTQINSAAMAIAKVERIFKFLDEEAEKDEGCISLVSVERKR